MRYLSALCCLLTLNVSAGITGMTNNSAVVGAQHLNTTITSTGTFVQAASPNGNVYQIRLQQGSNVIYLADANYNPNTLFMNVNVTSPNTVDMTDFSIPYNAALGTYTLVVGYLDPFLQFQGYPCSSYDSLQGAFTVLPPDGYIQGAVYEDLNRNGSRDAGENAVQNGTIRLFPGGVDYAVDANGSYSIPVSNGNYSVVWIYNSNDRRFLTSANDTIPVTVNNNNSTANDFGIYRKLRFCSPNQLIASRQNLLTIVGDTLFRPGTSTTYYISLRRNQSNYATTFSPNITNIDSNTASCRMTVPSISGTFDLVVYISGSGNPNSGVHILPNAVTVLPSTATISGNIYYDSNQNGISDAGEPRMYGQRLNLLPDNVYAFSGLNGNYYIGSLPGSHTVAWDSSLSSGFTLSSDSASYTFTNSVPVTGKDFGIISTLPPYTHNLYFAGVRPRCNTNNRYDVYITNKGNVPFNGRLYLLRDPLTVYNGSNIPASGSTASGDSIWWDIQNIQPYQPVNVFTYLLMPGPQNVINNRVLFEARDANQQVQASTYRAYPEMVLCSYDPNDKACTPEGTGIDHYTLISDELEYRIRFQNTGNDTAYDVRIYDRLDTALDRNTFQVVNSSHNVETTVDAQGQVTFFFRSIYLPDSNVDEPGSNGYVTYRIRAKASTPDFTRVENTAYIVFDLNPAVITNTTFNTLVTQIPLWIRPAPAPFPVSVSPNPFRESTRFVFANSESNTDRFELMDAMGRTVRTMRTGNGPMVLERENLSAGIYLYRFLDKQGRILHTGKVVVE